MQIDIAFFFLGHINMIFTINYKDPIKAYSIILLLEIRVQNDLWELLTFIVAYCTSSSKEPNRRKEFNARTRWLIFVILRGANLGGPEKNVALSEVINSRPRSFNPSNYQRS